MCIQYEQAAVVEPSYCEEGEEEEGDYCGGEGYVEPVSQTEDFGLED